MISITRDLLSIRRCQRLSARASGTCNRGEALLHQPVEESLSMPSHSRRMVLSSLLIGITCIIPPEGKAGLEKYVKKKKLDPLESYAPMVLQARGLLEAVDLADAKGSRQLLRSGPFFGIRTCIRSIGDYAAEKNPSEAAALVTTVFNSLDEFDYFMRSPDEERVVAREKLNKVLLSFDSLLATVPPDVMEISSQIVATVAKAQEVSREEDAKALEEDKALTSLLK